MKSGYITSDDVKIFYRVIGTGTPILMLHGNGEDHQIFKEHVKYLSKEYQVILMDSRGHGNSQFGNKRLNIELMAQDVHSLINELGLKKVILFGFSDGGNIALQFAVRYHNRFLAVIAVSPNVQPEGLKSSFMFLIKALNIGYKILLALHIPVHKRHQINELMILYPRISKAELSTIDVPVLILTGEKDVVRAEHLLELEEVIAGATVKVIKGANHLTMFQKTDKYIKLILRYLKKNGL